MPTLVWYCRTFLVFHAYNHNVDKKGHQTYYLEEKFEYDSRLKADLIKIVNLSLNKLSQAEPS